MTAFRVAFLLAVAAVSFSQSALGDTLVVCPPFLRGALETWETMRREQGHDLTVIEPPQSSAELTVAIRSFASRNKLKYVVLVGDVDTVPTAYAEAQINILWGSEPTIATDQRYGDIDGDGTPDVAVGRIPADKPDELAAFVRKVLQYEKSAGDSDWCKRLDVVAGAGGFGVVADSLIEASARSVFSQVVPATHAVRRLKVDPNATCQQISAGSFAWIYLGHGMPTMLDIAATSTGPKPILATSDVPTIDCVQGMPLAVLISCYTGAIDARSDCLAETLVLHEQGPIGAIAATRITMPYGNCVFGCQLLRAAFRESPGNLGDIWLYAQRETLSSAAADDSLRTSLDAVARGISPPQADLAAERREHVLLYQLLADPLLRLKFPSDTQLGVRLADAPEQIESR